MQDQATGALANVVELYRDAQRSGSEAFAKNTFAWIDEHIPIDLGIIVTGLRGATWVDAHFHGVADPAALMASHERVRHLDVHSQEMLSRPNVVLRAGHDDPRLAGRRFTPFREHLRRFDAQHLLGVAAPHATEGAMTTVLLVRGRKKRAFTDREATTFGAVAPHIVEAFCVNRTRWLGVSVGPPDPFPTENAPPPLALVNAQGRFVQTTPTFVRLFWPGEPPATTCVPPAALRAIRKGRAYPMPGRGHTLYATAEPTGGWLVRLRARSAVDDLTPREREIATLFARGVTYKSIASRLSLAPATVRNHLQRVYTKLGVSQREALSEMLQR